MKRGMTLISTLVGMALLAATLAAMVHLYSMAGLAVTVAESRTTALMIAQTRLETMQAQGYDKLPPIGSHPLQVPELSRLPQAEGSVTVSAGPLPDSRLIAVQMLWRQRPDRPQSSVSLSRIIAAQGMSR
jgi:type II secretory pathway pseudopilin PulG